MRLSNDMKDSLITLIVFIIVLGWFGAPFWLASSSAADGPTARTATAAFNQGELVQFKVNLQPGIVMGFDCPKAVSSTHAPAPCTYDVKVSQGSTHTKIRYPFVILDDIREFEIEKQPLRTARR